MKKQYSLIIVFIAFFGYSTLAQFITSTGSIGVQRKSQKAQLLNNGNVLMCGGEDGGFLPTTYYSSAKIFTGSSWSSTSSMGKKRIFFSMALLDNGNVIAIGGWTGTENTRTSEIYDVAAGTWSYTDSTVSESNYSVALNTGTGKILMCHYLCELYDQTSNTWATANSMVQPRQNFAMITLSDGRILVTGGNTNTAEIFDPATETWTMTTDTMTEIRANHTSVLLDDGKVLIAGGGNATLTSEVFDPSDESFTASNNDMVRDHYRCEMGTLPSGEAVIYGAAGFGFSSYNAEVYDPAINKWYNPSSGSGQYGAEHYTMTELQNGKLLVAGGSPSINGANTSAVLINGTNLPAPTGMDNIVGDGGLMRVFPNPSGGEFDIDMTLVKTDNVQLVIENMLGQVVFADKISSATPFYTRHVDISDAGKGLYILKIRSESGELTKKIIVD